MTRSRPFFAANPAATPLHDARPIRVAIVEDCAEVRFLLAAIIELDGRFTVVAEASDVRAALVAVPPVRADVVLVDLRLGTGSGTTVIRRLRRGGFPGCIVVITGSIRPRDHAAALGAGADAVQDKCAMTSTMLDALADLVDRHATGATDP